MENNTTNLNNLNVEKINIREIVVKYLKKWPWFLISVVICLFIAYFYLKITNDSYQVQTTILIRKDKSSNGLLDMSMLDGLSSVSGGGTSKEVEDEIQVLTSKSLMTNVVRSLDIETEYYIKNGLRYEEIYPLTPIKLIVPLMFNDTLNKQVVFKITRNDDSYHIDFKYNKISNEYEVPNLNHALKTPIGSFKFNQIISIKKYETYKIISYSTRALTDIYCKNINVSSLNKKSNAIGISTISTCPKKSVVVLNKLVELYNQDAVIDKNLIAQSTAEFVQERINLIGNELNAVEKNVENYKKENNLFDISAEAGIYLQSATAYDNKLSELEIQFGLVNYIESYVKDNKHQYDLIPANLGITDGSLLAIMQQYNGTLLERIRLMRTTNDKNPVFTQLEQQLKGLRAGIISSISSIKDGMKIIRKNAVGRDSKFNSKINNIPTQERQFVEIKRQQEIKQKLYLFLLQKREENAMSLASTIPSAKTVDAAYTSLLPVAPRKMIILFFAFIIGFLLPIVYIYISDMLNNKILDIKDFKRLVKTPYLGSIGLKKDSEVVVVREGVTTPIVEMFRIIRTNLQFMLSGKSNPVILVTSSISGEGKSFFSINLAMSFALMKKKVLLVGLDIRNPMLVDYMHLAKDSGITIYISDESTELADIISSSNLHPFLDVIPAGPIPPNPAELIMSQRLDELFIQLRGMYDYIIVDSAPIGLVSDTYLLNRLVDNSIYVARQNYTPREACGLINEIYDNNKLNNMGVILNGTNESSGYGYGYGYGYGNEAKKKKKRNNYANKINLINKIRR